MLVVLPWAGVAALMASERFPFHTGSLWKVFAKNGAFLTVSIAGSLIMAGVSIGGAVELRSDGGWVSSPWAWIVAPLLMIVGVRQLRYSFQRFYERIPLVPEASGDP